MNEIKIFLLFVIKNDLKRLFQRTNKNVIEPMDVTDTYENFTHFQKCIENPLSDGQVLLYWRWVPSFKKAKEYKVTDVLDFFEHLENDDEYKEGTDGLPHEDKQNHLIYKNHDYLLIVVHKIWNGFWSRSYKITVTDSDEPNVKKVIDKMKQDTLQSWT